MICQIMWWKYGLKWQVQHKGSYDKRSLMEVINSEWTLHNKFHIPSGNN